MAEQSRPEGLTAVGLRGAATWPVKAGTWMKIWVPAYHPRHGIYRWKYVYGALFVEFGHPFMGWIRADWAENFVENLQQNFET